MNSVTITGHLTRDPKLKEVGERTICELRVAVDNGRHPTTYIDAVTFDGQAYACAEFLAKGRKVGVDGRLALSEWRDAGGRRHWRYRVLGRVEFLDRPPQAVEAQAAGTEPIGPRPTDEPAPVLAA